MYIVGCTCSSNQCCGTRTAHAPSPTPITIRYYAADPAAPPPPTPPRLPPEPAAPPRSYSTAAGRSTSATSEHLLCAAAPLRQRWPLTTRSSHRRATTCKFQMHNRRARIWPFASMVYRSHPTSLLLLALPLPRVARRACAHPLTDLRVVRNACIALVVRRRD